MDGVCVCVCVCISPHNAVQHCSHTITHTKNNWQVEEGEKEPRQLICRSQLTSPLGWDRGTRVQAEVVQKCLCGAQEEEQDVVQEYSCLDEVLPPLLVGLDEEVQSEGWEEEEDGGNLGCMCACVCVCVRVGGGGGGGGVCTVWYVPIHQTCKHLICTYM